jgi:hypothetical protein
MSERGTAEEERGGPVTRWTRRLLVRRRRTRTDAWAWAYGSLFRPESSATANEGDDGREESTGRAVSGEGNQ